MKRLIKKIPILGPMAVKLSRGIKSRLNPFQGSENTG